MTFKELRWWLLFIIILVVTVRAIFFFVVVPYDPVAQSRDIYLEIARNVVAGQGFSGGEKVEPTATRGPIPVYFFALVLWLFGDHTLSIALANWLVEAMAGVLLLGSKPLPLAVVQ
jgi:4-amino-4-deoxy-L-arabinose transferase-like glycosyltransferase